MIDTLAVNDKQCRGCDQLGCIVPVDMWESAFPIVDPMKWGKHMAKPSNVRGTNSWTEGTSRKRPRGSSNDKMSAEFASDESALKYMQDLIYVSKCSHCGC